MVDVIIKDNKLMVLNLYTFFKKMFILTEINSGLDRIDGPWRIQEHVNIVANIFLKVQAKVTCFLTWIAKLVLKSR